MERWALPVALLVALTISVPASAEDGDLISPSRTNNNLPTPRADCVPVSVTADVNGTTVTPYVWVRTECLDAGL